MFDCQLFTDADRAKLGSGTHIIFCLDESGSMNGQSWYALTTAYNSFIQQRRNDQSLDDTVSIIKFQSYARVEHEMVALRNAPALGGMVGGGTDFSAALQQVSAVLQRRSMCAQNPLLVFMSDGEATADTSTMRSLCQQYPSFRAEFIGLGSGHFSELRQMASACPSSRGAFRQATSAQQLTKAFTEIATNCTPVKQLIDRFGQKMASDIADKIIANRL